MNTRVLVIASLLTACAAPATTQRPPPPSVRLGSITPGTVLPVDIDGARAGATVYLGGSARPLGSGPCPALAGGRCLDLVAPVLLDTAIADSAGHVQFLVPIPQRLATGTQLHLQALAVTPTSAALTAPATRTVTSAADQDADGFRGPDDCDDLDATAHIGATEVCDGRDNDCDGQVDGPGIISRDGVNYAAVQDAIAAGPGVVTLCPGTYVENLVLDGTGATELVGIGGPSQTIIDASYGDVGVLLRNASPNSHIDLRMEGITVRESARIGIQTGADVTAALHDLVIEHNTEQGLFVGTGAVVISDSAIRHNQRSGLYVVGYADVTNVSITDNQEWYEGGGIRLTPFSRVDLRNSTVARNSAVSSGGGAVVPRDSALYSWGSDWSVGADDNGPDDIALPNSNRIYGYGSAGDIHCDGVRCRYF